MTAYKMTIQGIEFQFCSDWQEWGQLDTFTLLFMDVTPLPWVAELVGATHLDYMEINCDSSLVKFGVTEDNEHVYTMTVGIGEKIK